MPLPIAILTRLERHMKDTAPSLTTGSPLSAEEQYTAVIAFLCPRRLGNTVQDCRLVGLLVEGTRDKLNCKDRSSLDTCMKQLPPIIDQAELKGIPSSKKDVDHACNAFKTGMGCMDAYFDACLSESDRKIFESHVAGARHTFSFLCDDPGFQKEYLMYTQCYKGISRDWDACANKFISLVEEEMGRKNSTDQSRLVELCCAKHGFLKCVYYASWLKCRKEEAIFIRKIADTLASIRVYTPRCQTVDVEICSRSTSLHSLHLPSILVFVLGVMFLAWA